MKFWKKNYFKENPGASFVIAFMAALMLSAFFLIAGNEDYANGAAIVGYFALVIGVFLQLFSLIRSKKAGSNKKVA